MQPEIQSAIIQVTGAFFIGVLVTYLGLRLQRKQKIIEYQVVSMPLLGFKPKKEQPISVSVDKYILTGVETDKGISLPVKTAFGFEIELVNVGNEHIKEPKFNIQFDRTAKIIEWEAEPTMGDSEDIEIFVDKSKLNVIRIKAPYINMGEKVLIRVTTTDNTSGKYKVNVDGFEVTSRPSRISFRATILWVLSLFVPVLVLVILNTESIKSSRVVSALGVSTEPSWKLVLPLWVKLVFIFWTVITGGMAIYSMIKIISKLRNRIRTRWDLEEIDEKQVR